MCCVVCLCKVEHAGPIQGHCWHALHCSHWPTPPIVSAAVPMCALRPPRSLCALERTEWVQHPPLYPPLFAPNSYCTGLRQYTSIY